MNKQKIFLCFSLLFIWSSALLAPRGRAYRLKKQAAKESMHNVQQANTQDSRVLSHNPRAHIDIDQVGAMPRNTFRPQDLNFKKSVLDNPLISIEKSTDYSKNAPAKVLVIPPCPPAEIEEASIEFNFENADLYNFIKQIEDIFEVTFITADAIKPVTQGQKEIRGNKISFKTHKTLTKKEAWNLFVTFLDIAGLSVIPHTDPKIYRIINAGATAQKSPLPTFIGVDYTALPETDDVIRYLYFIENSTTDVIEGVLKQLISNPSFVIMLKEHKGFIITDKAYNIKMLMQIIKELDKATMPETMSVIKLRNAIAKDIVDLYKDLIPREDQSRFFAKKQPSLFFPENIKMIPVESRNILILLGPADAIKKIEEFITKHIDVELDQAYSSLYHYQLKFATAETVADVMNNVTQDFARANPDITRYGGVRGTDQFMRDISFTAEKQTNRVIIKGYYEDYLKAVEIIEKLDEEQPQVAVEGLILTVDVTDAQSMGTALRSKIPGPNGFLGNNIKFQTSGFFQQGIQVQSNATTGVTTLLANLLNLITGTTSAGTSIIPAGTSLLTLGQDINGVWGIFEVLQSITDSEIVANPFLVATNNTKASVELGQTRRGVTSEIVNTSSSSNAFGNFDAFIKVEVTPHINSDGMITLELAVFLDDFTNTVNFVDVTMNMRRINTTAIVADKEVIALGGLIRDNVIENTSKVPILGDIPIIGWLFKNKTKRTIKQSLLILISTTIIEPKKHDALKEFTTYHTQEYVADVNSMSDPSDMRDPVYRNFFVNKAEWGEKTFKGFLFKRAANTQEREQAKAHAKESEKMNLIASEQNAHIISQQMSELPEKNRMQTIHDKKRTRLSLTEFLHNNEKRS